MKGLARYIMERSDIRRNPAEWKTLVDDIFYADGVLSAQNRKVWHSISRSERSAALERGKFTGFVNGDELIVPFMTKEEAFREISKDLADAYDNGTVVWDDDLKWTICYYDGSYADIDSSVFRKNPNAASYYGFYDGVTPNTLDKRKASIILHNLHNSDTMFLIRRKGKDAMFWADTHRAYEFMCEIFGYSYYDNGVKKF